MAWIIIVQDLPNKLSVEINVVRTSMDTSEKKIHEIGNKVSTMNITGSEDIESNLAVIAAVDLKKGFLESDVFLDFGPCFGRELRNGHRIDSAAVLRWTLIGILVQTLASMVTGSGMIGKGVRRIIVILPNHN
jgi:hypothetical protein